MLKQSGLAETRKKGWGPGDQLMVYGSWHSLASFFIQRHRGCQHIDACQIEVSRQWPRGGIFVLESWSPASIERRQQSKCSYLKMISINVDLAVKDAMFSLWSTHEIILAHVVGCHGIWRLAASKSPRWSNHHNIQNCQGPEVKFVGFWS